MYKVYQVKRGKKTPLVRTINKKQEEAAEFFTFQEANEVAEKMNGSKSRVVIEYITTFEDSIKNVPYL